MRKILPLLIMSLCFFSAMAGNMQPGTIRPAAVTFMQGRCPGVTPASMELLAGKNQAVAGYLIHFIPSGFIVISASDKTAPVYAYSLESDFNPPVNEALSLKEMITEDLQNRILVYDRLPKEEQEKIAGRWKSFLNGNSDSPVFEQWPPQGTTTTGGWLKTNWTQTDPYNGMCPMDLNAGERSIAGCPAIAMAQIVNYHREINHTRFDTGDDYYHNFGSGNSFWIDDDYLSRGFPSYDTLNLWLDTLEAAYQINATLSASLKAALCFACGVAAHQVFSASVSGTYGLDQAYSAYQRFGFTGSRLISPDDTTLNSLIAGNVKVALPVHLGLIVSGGSGGHNVVVDGYNTDEFYHFNFGWGGQANGWYTIPPVNIPYNLTIVEGAIVDVKSSLYTWAPGGKNASLPVRVFPNPCREKVIIEGLNEEAILSIYSLAGERMLTASLPAGTGSISTGDLPSGCYIYRITGQQKTLATGKIIQK